MRSTVSASACGGSATRRLRWMPGPGRSRCCAVSGATARRRWSASGWPVSTAVSSTERRWPKGGSPGRGPWLPAWLTRAASRGGLLWWTLRPPFWTSAIADAERAVAAGRQYGDVDLEIVSLARLGACRVGTGEVVEGRRDLQQAMTAAVSGEGQDIQYVGEALCTLLEVAGWLGDPGMVEPWAQHLAEFRSAYAFGPLLPLENTSGADLISAFCTSCCGGVYLVTGRLDVAERELVEAVSQLTTTGCRPRCLHPVARLAELRVLQGRSKRRRRYWWASSPSGSAPWSRRPWTSRRDGRSGRRPGSWPRSTVSRPPRSGRAGQSATGRRGARRR